MSDDRSGTFDRAAPRKRPPQIEMTLDGQVRPPARGGLPLATKIGGAAILVAFMAGGIAIAALALWLAFAVIPIALGAALVAYLAFRFQIWRARAAGGSLRRM